MAVMPVAPVIDECRMPEKEYLEGMLKVLGRGGKHWGINELYDNESGTYCLVGAFGKVHCDDPDPGGIEIFKQAEHCLPVLTQLAFDVIGNDWGAEPGSGNILYRWNDDFVPSMGDWKKIRKAIKKVIKKLEAVK
jgi:hypothetical protein